MGGVVEVASPDGSWTHMTIEIHDKATTNVFVTDKHVHIVKYA